MIDRPLDKREIMWYKIPKMRNEGGGGKMKCGRCNTELVDITTQDDLDGQIFCLQCKTVSLYQLDICNWPGCVIFTRNIYCVKHTVTSMFPKSSWI